MSHLRTEIVGSPGPRPSAAHRLTASSCSLACYTLHKTSHSEAEATVIQKQQAARRDRPGTTQRVRKQDFAGFEGDADFERLLERYPTLKAQLQVVYGLTLEPGPDDSRSWNRGPLLGSLDPDRVSNLRGRGRGRGARGPRGGRGGREQMPQEDRQHGMWTQGKGDREALAAVKKWRTGHDEEGMAEGMREFVELCQLKFGRDGDVV